MNVSLSKDGNRKRLCTSGTIWHSGKDNVWRQRLCTKSTWVCMGLGERSREIKFLHMVSNILMQYGAQAHRHQVCLWLCQTPLCLKW